MSGNPTVNQLPPGSGRMIKEDDTVVNMANMIEAIYNGLIVNKNAGISVSGSKLEEQLTQADAAAGVLTFAQNLGTVEIYNTDAVNAGTFAVNGITINVPAGKTFKSSIGGTPAKTVTITGATTYIVSRYS